MAIRYLDQKILGMVSRHFNVYLVKLGILTKIVRELDWVIMSDEILKLSLVCQLGKEGGGHLTDIANHFIIQQVFTFFCEKLMSQFSKVFLARLIKKQKQMHKCVYTKRCS